MRFAFLWFLPVTIACYCAALITSSVLVRWVLPGKIRAELGNGTRFVAIDGIRGYLAFGVYLHHCLVTWAFLRSGAWSPPVHNFENQLGQASVAVFFMITAFLFWGRASARRRMDWRAFFVSRLFRVYPLYLFVVSLVCIAVGYKSHWIAAESAGRIARDIRSWLFLWPSRINRYAQTSLVVADVTWTLLYEAWFYISLPFLALVFLKKSQPWKKIGAIAVMATLLGLNHLSLPITATFLGGFAAVYWVMDQKRVELARGTPATFLALACLAGDIFFLHSPYNVAGIVLLSVFFLAIASGNLLFGLLKMPAALWIGEISYSIYLLHGIILWIILQNLLPRLGTVQGTPKQLAEWAIGITPIVLLCSSATYLAIERPLIELGRRVSAKQPVNSRVAQYSQ